MFTEFKTCVDDIYDKSFKGQKVPVKAVLKRGEYSESVIQLAIEYHLIFNWKVTRTDEGENIILDFSLDAPLYSRPYSVGLKMYKEFMKKNNFPEDML